MITLIFTIVFTVFIIMFHCRVRKYFFLFATKTIFVCTFTAGVTGVAAIAIAVIDVAGVSSAIDVAGVCLCLNFFHNDLCHYSS